MVRTAVAMSTTDRMDLLAELIALRAWEHRHQEFDEMAARAADITEQLNEESTR